MLRSGASHLLARLEAHPGPAIVMSRRRQNLDPAFLRRLLHVIDFAAPGE